MIVTHEIEATERVAECLGILHLSCDDCKESHLTPETLEIAYDFMAEWSIVSVKKISEPKDGKATVTCICAVVPANPDKNIDNG